MRVAVFVVVAAAVVSAGFNVPRAFHAYHLSRGESLLYVDTLEAERHLRQAASIDIGHPWANIYLARIMIARGDLTAAEQQIDLAFEKLSADADFDRMVLHNEAGKLSSQRGEYQSALDNFLQSQALVDQLRAEPNAPPDLIEDAAISSLNIARALRGLGRFEEALEFAEQSLRERNALLLTSLGSPSSRLNYAEIVQMRAVALSDLGRILLDLDRLDEATEKFEESLQQYERPDAVGMPINQRQIEQASVLWSLARIHAQRDDIDASVEAFFSALDLMEAVFERDPDHPGVRTDHSRIAFELAELFANHPEHAEFEAFETEYLSGRVSQAAYDYYAIWTHLLAGDVHAGQDARTEALQAFSIALGKAQRRAESMPEEPSAMREVWAAHFRVAQLGLPESRSHAAEALSQLEAMQSAGTLRSEDIQYIEFTRAMIEVE